VHMPMTTSPEATVRNLPSSGTISAISNIFRETAELYLQTVINDASPGSSLDSHLISHLCDRIAETCSFLLLFIQVFPK
jgi:hypothetical protein